jgi:hypothetical protein
MDGSFGRFHAQGRVWMTCSTAVRGKARDAASNDSFVGYEIMKYTFLKHALWAALFAAGAAMAQDAAISGSDFTHGKADAQLATIGGKAAANGQTVVVTAPTYWQGKVAAKIRAGAHGKAVAIRFSTGFYENVLVRTEAGAPAEAAMKPEPKPEPKVAAKAEPKTEARPESRIAKVERKPEIKAVPEPEISDAPAETRPVPVVATAPAPKPAEEPPHVAAPVVMQAPVQQAPASVAPHPAPEAASNIASIPQVSHQPVVVPIPTAAISGGGMASEALAAHANDGAAVRQRMLASLNDGRPAMGSLGESQLRPGDQVYADGDTRAVVRLEGLHRSLYWLQGPVDLERVQFMPQGDGHYEVTGTIDPKAPAAHRANADAHRVVKASVPAAGSAARARLEQQYNNGQPITGNLTVARLQPEDRLLVDGDAIIVARREGNSMARYWFSGSIDLGQTGIQKLDGDTYRVAGNSLH